MQENLPIQSKDAADVILKLTESLHDELTGEAKEALLHAADVLNEQHEKDAIIRDLVGLLCDFDIDEKVCKHAGKCEADELDPFQAMERIEVCYDCIIRHAKGNIKKKGSNQ